MAGSGLFRMATLTITEQHRLGLVRPELMQRLLRLLDDAQAQLGFTLAVPDYGGTRTTAVQQQLYADSLAQGVGGALAYPVAKPGTGRHEYGAAFDLHIVDGGSNDDGTGSEGDYQQLADVAQNLGLVAGFYFANSDPYHFQLNEPLADSQARWAAMKRAGIIQTVAVVLVAVGLASALTRH
jgi:LAS superfamily LD-carboxypeptidase LdcB